MRYVEAGSGQPIICLQSGAGLQLSRALELLSRTFRVVAFELPASGTSPAEDLARTVNAALAELGIERYSVLAFGPHARAGLWMAIERPHAVDAIVLSAPLDALEPRAAELAHPVLVLFGTAEEEAALEDAHRYRELLQNGHVMMVYNASRAIEADRPEAFASVAGDFLLRKAEFVVNLASALLHP